MTSAVAERGNYLEGLEDSLNNVSMSATNYLSQAKNSAVSLLPYSYRFLRPTRMLILVSCS